MKNNRQSDFNRCIWVLMLGASLVSCSDKTMEPSSELFSTAADVHFDEAVIQETIEIDEIIATSNAGALGGQLSLFQGDTELLDRNALSVPTAIAKKGIHERNAYFGDLHVHTTYSFDGYAFGTLATPRDAYRFAKGEPIKNPAGFNMQLTKPMDFYAVTDHAVFLGFAKCSGRYLE